MSQNRKKLRTPSPFTKAILKMIDDYATETGDESGDLMKIARIFHAQRKIDPPEYNPVKAIAKVLANACRQDYIADENGDPVRRRHAYAISSENKQTTFSWFRIEDATPEKMKLSALGRRNGTLMDLMQLIRDVKHFNVNYNPGEPIEVDTNFGPDIAELSMPGEYPGEPPEDEEDHPDAP